MLLKKYKILIRRDFKEVHKRIDNTKDVCLICNYFSNFGCNISSFFKGFCRVTQFEFKGYVYIPDY